MQNEQEQWAAVPGLEGEYEVSSLGRVRSYIPKGPRRDSRGELRFLTEPHFLKPNKGNRGYLTVYLKGSAPHPQPATIHSLVLAAFVGPRPEGMEIRHLNGQHLDNRLENLRYGTRSENVRDAVKHGTHAWARLTHCKRGHEFNDENTRRRVDGKRDCLVCQALRNAAAANRRREVAA